MQDITFTPPSGSDLYHCILKAIEFAKEKQSDVFMTFNGIELQISHLSYAVDISRIYFLECEIARRA